MATLEILRSKYCASKIKQIHSEFGRKHPVAIYFIVFILGGSLLCFYWLSIGRALVLLEHAAKVPDNSTNRPFTNTDKRPWISVDVEIASPMTYDANGDARITFNFILTNTGDAPAANIWVSPEMVLVFGDSFIPQRRIADLQRIQSQRPSFLGEVLFPGGRLIQAYNIGISRSAVQEYHSWVNKSYGPNSSILANLWPASLVGCVDYKFTNGEGHHQTGFVYELGVRSNEAPGGWVAIDSNEIPIPLNRLILVGSIFSVLPN
ncbi:MAG TPA: hypothetical protein VNW30_03220 [Opitutaceae bacterium]|nr:hypothetical protein [Opitutaceae bacterium]